MITLLCVIALTLQTPRVLGQTVIPDTETESPPMPTEADGPTYPVSEFILEYIRANPGLPSLEEVIRVEVKLGQTQVQTKGAYVVARPGVPSLTIRLEDLPQLPIQTFHASALQRVLETIRDYFTERDFAGVYVAPDPYEINENGEDLRPEGQTELALLITTGVVTEIRTLASGERIPAEERINNPLQKSIIDDSPIRPQENEDKPRHDLLRKNVLDRYLFFKSRHPGRRVDAAVSPAEEPGGIALDFLVTENKPFTPYFQVSNTGTPQTDRIVYRFGFFHTQLTNSDDILSFDYSTAGFKSHTLLGSYDRPFENDRWRWRAAGGYQEYSADQVGVQDAQFRGKSWHGGGDVSWNFYQKRELFLDVVGGARFEHQEVSNEALFTGGNADFIFPHVGVRLDRTTGWYSTRGLLDIEFQVASNDAADLNGLGRPLPDEYWTVLKWGIDHYVFLEPLLNRAAWEDPSTPGSSTLAHEIAVSFRGQYAFDSRLPPQYQMVLGGLHTVRGYRQSIVAGDTVLVGNVEYRYHLPHGFDIQAEPRQLFGRPFRTAPQYVYGSPDWDLILKVFLDAGLTLNSDKLFFEEDETLIGAGIGAELQLWRNLRARLDWGFALTDVDSADTQAGSNRLYFSLTVLF